MIIHIIFSLEGRDVILLHISVRLIKMGVSDVAPTQVSTTEFVAVSGSVLVGYFNIIRTRCVVYAEPSVVGL